jgi:pyruvate/2-oxoglutarate dehydrogenase complex dihydrolipoamide acyltransferase (E2) component
VAKVEFLLPDVGEGLEEGEIVAWLVAPGDTVARDQPLVEVQTDKALVELPSPVAGQIVSLAFAAGDIVKVGQTLVVLEAGDGAPPAVPPAPAHAAGGALPLQTPPLSASTAPSAATRPKAAPAVRKLALDRGVDLATVTGTGPGGRILAADVEAAAAAPPPAPSQTGVPGSGGTARQSAGSAEPGRLGWMETGRHPLKGIRRVTAEAMDRSWSEIPHFTTLDEIDATGLLAARKRLGEAGIDVTIGALFVAAVARGLRRYPVFNASLERPATPAAEAGQAGGGGAIIVHADVNVGLAVATTEGLVVPVIKQADQRNLADVGAEVRRVTQAARDRRIQVGDLRGGTFTITNYGALGGRYATPLIRPPEVGIMGFGAIRPRPFVVDGEVKARPTLPWSLSSDHRVIDGDVATAFSEYVTGLLSDPVALLAELLAGGSSGS